MYSTFVWQKIAVRAHSLVAKWFTRHLRLVALPNDFSYTTALTNLDLSRNRVRYLPLDFGQLFSLKVFR